MRLNFKNKDQAFKVAHTFSQSPAHSVTRLIRNKKGWQLEVKKT